MHGNKIYNSYDQPGYRGTWFMAYNIIYCNFVFDTVITFDQKWVTKSLYMRLFQDIIVNSKITMDPWAWATDKQLLIYWWHLLNQCNFTSSWAHTYYTYLHYYWTVSITSLCIVPLILFWWCLHSINSLHTCRYLKMIDYKYFNFFFNPLHFPTCFKYNLHMLKILFHPWQCLSCLHYKPLTDYPKWWIGITIFQTFGKAERVFFYRLSIAWYL